MGRSRRSAVGRRASRRSRLALRHQPVDLAHGASYDAMPRPRPVDRFGMRLGAGEQQQESGNRRDRHPAPVRNEQERHEQQGNQCVDGGVDQGIQVARGAQALPQLLDRLLRPMLLRATAWPNSRITRGAWRRVRWRRPQYLAAFSEFVAQLCCRLSNRKTVPWTIAAAEENEQEKLEVEQRQQNTEYEQCDDCRDYG